MGESPVQGPDHGPPFLPLGGHEYRLEGAEGPGDVFHWRIHGPVELADIKQVLAAAQQIDARYHHVFMLIRIVGPGGFDPVARRYYFEWRRQHSIDNRWVYVVGASPVSRALIMLVLRGTALLTGRQLSIQLVRDEDEARRSIAELRVSRGLEPDSQAPEPPASPPRAPRHS